LLLDVLSDLGGWGQRVGATLCVEAGRAGPDDLARLIAALPAGSLTCDVVTGALVVHGHDPVTAVEKLSGHVGYVHATDAVAGAFAGRGRAVILGTGHVDVAGVLGTLEERGYRGWIGLEPVDARDGARELAGAVEYLRAM
jgi:sugar phosphate isomerase/epimerase